MSSKRFGVRANGFRERGEGRQTGGGEGREGVDEREGMMRFVTPRRSLRNDQVHDSK